MNKLVCWFFISSSLVFGLEISPEIRENLRSQFFTNDIKKIEDQFAVLNKKISELKKDYSLEEAFERLEKIKDLDPRKAAFLESFKRFLGILEEDLKKQLNGISAEMQKQSERFMQEDQSKDFIMNQLISSLQKQNDAFLAGKVQFEQEIQRLEEGLSQKEQEFADLNQKFTRQNDAFLAGKVQFEQEIQRLEEGLSQKEQEFADLNQKFTRLLKVCSTCPQLFPNLFLAQWMQHSLQNPWFSHRSCLGKIFEKIKINVQLDASYVPYQFDHNRADLFTEGVIFQGGSQLDKRWVIFGEVGYHFSDLQWKREKAIFQTLSLAPSLFYHHNRAFFYAKFLADYVRYIPKIIESFNGANMGVQLAGGHQFSFSSSMCIRSEIDFNYSWVFLGFDQDQEELNNLVKRSASFSSLRARADFFKEFSFQEFSWSLKMGTGYGWMWPFSREVCLEREDIIFEAGQQILFDLGSVFDFKNNISFSLDLNGAISKNYPAFRVEASCDWRW